MPENISENMPNSAKRYAKIIYWFGRFNPSEKY